MTTHHSPQNEQATNAPHAMEEGTQGGMPSPPSAPQQIVLPKQLPEMEEEEAFYFFEDEQADMAGAPFVAPFQVSNALPAVSAQAQPSGQGSPDTAGTAPAKKSGRLPRLSLKMIALLFCAVVIVGTLAMSALAQTTPPLQTGRNGSSQAVQTGHSPQLVGNQGHQNQGSKPQPTPMPSPAPITGTNGQGQTSFSWVPQQLPDGWMNAGLQPGDDIQALRTAVAFNDREMSLDYRSVGTRNHHNGTFTAATFLMTAACKQRFQINDMRVINNSLFDMVAQTKLLRLVVDPHPQIVKFAQVGQQQFAWVDVTFQLWLSQIDPKNPGQRIEGKELDQANQPRIHHMIVLLLRVPQQNAGNNPAMGGTGWLVSAYSLDPINGTLPTILQPA